MTSPIEKLSSYGVVVTKPISSISQIIILEILTYKYSINLWFVVRVNLENKAGLDRQEKKKERLVKYKPPLLMGKCKI